MKSLKNKFKWWLRFRNARFHRPASVFVFGQTPKISTQSLLSKEIFFARYGAQGKHSAHKPLLGISSYFLQNSDVETSRDAA